MWIAFGTFWATHAILLVALFSTGKLPDSPLVAPVVTGVGVLIAVIWHGVQLRALGHIRRYEELASRLEGRLEVEPALSISLSRYDPDRKQFFPAGPSARKIMGWCSVGTACAWVVAWVTSLVL